MVTRGRSEPLDVGRTTHTVPPALARAVIARDRHCRYEGCVGPLWACDIHHRVPWSRHGPTALATSGSCAGSTTSTCTDSAPNVLSRPTRADGTSLPAPQ